MKDLVLAAMSMRGNIRKWGDLEVLLEHIREYAPYDGECADVPVDAFVVNQPKVNPVLDVLKCEEGEWNQ